MLIKLLLVAILVIGVTSHQVADRTLQAEWREFVHHTTHKVAHKLAHKTLHRYIEGISESTEEWEDPLESVDDDFDSTSPTTELDEFADNYDDEQESPDVSSLYTEDDENLPEPTIPPEPPVPFGQGPPPMFVEEGITRKYAEATTENDQENDELTQYSIAKFRAKQLKAQRQLEKEADNTYAAYSTQKQVAGILSPDNLGRISLLQEQMKLSSRDKNRNRNRYQRVTESMSNELGESMDLSKLEESVTSDQSQGQSVNMDSLAVITQTTQALQNEAEGQGTGKLPPAAKQVMKIIPHLLKLMSRGPGGGKGKKPKPRDIGKLTPKNPFPATEGFAPPEGFFSMSKECEESLKRWLGPCAFGDDKEGVWPKLPAKGGPAPKGPVDAESRPSLFAAAGKTLEGAVSTGTYLQNVMKKIGLVG